MTPSRRTSAAVTALIAGALAVPGASMALATGEPAPTQAPGAESALAALAPPEDSGPDGLGARTRTPRATQVAVKVTGEPGAATAKAYLASQRSALAIDPATLVPGETTRVPGSPVVSQRFTQKVGNVPVFGSGYVVRMKDEAQGSTVIGTSGSYYSDLKVSTTPGLGPAQVSKQVLGNLHTQGVRDPKLRVGSLAVFPGHGGRLAYRVSAVGTPRGGERQMREGLVDAATGRVLLSWSRQTADAGTPVSTTGTSLLGKQVPLQLTKTSRGTELVDRSHPQQTATGHDIRTIDGGGQEWYEVLDQLDTIAPDVADSVPVNGRNTETGAVDAHYGATQVFDFYASKMGRNSLDGKGGPIRSIVNALEWGQPWANAFWWDSENVMVYGGAGVPGFRPFSAGLDVVAHEMTHGVISHSANLNYVGQSGAVNEAYADYFGNAIENTVENRPMTSPDAGLLGEDLCTDKAPQDCALRNIDNTSTVKDAVGTFGDENGVHTNSHIYAGAMWRVRKAIGAEKADKLMYTVLTQYMGPDTSFSRGAFLTVMAAHDTGMAPKDVQAVMKVFGDAGMTPGWEDRLGHDSTTLVARAAASTGLFTILPGADLTGKSYVMDDLSLWDGETNTAILAGRTDKPGVQPLVTESGDWLVEAPTTDGRTAVYHRQTYGGGDIRQLWTIDLATRAKRMITSGDEFIYDHVVDGSNVAWVADKHINDDIPNQEIVVKIGDAAPKRYKLPRHMWTGAIHLRGNDLAYSLSPNDEPGDSQEASVWVMDIRTGVSTKIDSADTDDDNSFVGGAILTKSRLVYIKGKGDRARAALVVKEDHGRGATRTFFTPGDAKAPAAPWIDASDQAVTYGTVEGLDPQNEASAAKLMQISLTGDPTPKRVSCNRGAQAAPAMDDERGVLWASTHRLDLSLEFRATPAGTCQG